MDKIKVMVIDRQPLFRAGICQALAKQEDFETLERNPSDDLVELIETDYPDVLLLDIGFPSFSGLKLGKRITQYYPNIRLIILSPNLDDAELLEIIKTGAVAYINKNTAASEELIDTIKRTCRGEYPINDSLLTRPKVAEQVMRQFQNLVSMTTPMGSITAPLTHRETQILNYVAEGNSNKQIATTLKISEQTIKNHISSILRKLNANDRAHAVLLAIRHGWISAEENASSEK